jgi:hypothetical protein
MVHGYEACGASGEMTFALVHQRALDYIGLAMRDYNRIYRAVPAALWKRFHQLFERVEAAGLAGALVDDLVNRENPPASCIAVYVQVLLAQHATPDALTLVQNAVIERWLKQWSPLVTVAKTVRHDDTVPRLAVIFGADTGARDGKAVQPAPHVRYLELGPLQAVLTQLMAGLRNGKTPADLALGGTLSPAACENLLLMLNMQWCGVGDGRIDERNPSSLKVMVSMSIAAMHFHLTGRAFRQPGAPLTKREEDDMRSFGYVSDATERALLSQNSGALETWEIINHSRSGLLGLCRQPDAGTRICHNQLVGLRTATSRTFYLGIVQRLLIDESGAVSLGLRVIPGTPKPIAMRVRDEFSIDADADKFDRALLLAADEARKAPASVIMAPNYYEPNRSAELYIDAQQPVKLTALLDKGVNFERATFATF